MMDAYDIAGERIKKLRKSKGFTQDQLSKELNGLITSRQISSWETTGRDGKPAKSRRIISVEYLIPIAKYFGVSVDYLLGLTDNPDPSKRVQIDSWDLAAETAKESFPYDHRAADTLDSLFVCIAHSIKHMEERADSGYAKNSGAIHYYLFCVALLESIFLTANDGQAQEKATLSKLLNSFRDYIGNILNNSIKDDTLVALITGRADVKEIDHDIFGLYSRAHDLG